MSSMKRFMTTAHTVCCIAAAIIVCVWPNSRQGMIAVGFLIGAVVAPLSR